ncbi:MAG: chorismate synthase [Defluviitaleaceae bacterium]|nr:chorismate synthase [Defluviitaleaceae bacterium]
MSSVWGERIKLTIFGESRGEAIGVVIDGLPPGEKIDMDECQVELSRRAPGRDEISSARKEPDDVRVISGLKSSTTTGAPLCALIENVDAEREASDNRRIARPGHADYTAHLKYKGFADMRGGGHFSGRLTAPLVFAGAVARQMLARRGVVIGARVVRIGSVADRCPFQPLPQAFEILRSGGFPALCPDAAKLMRNEIVSAKAGGDSVGGIVEAAATGVPAGLGAPFFGSVESALSALLFSIPAVKGVEFGDGFSISQMRGSQANDAIRAEGGAVAFSSNRCGGILGGITNGEPIIVRAGFKPTPSIAIEQPSVNLETMENSTVRSEGRNDPCVVLRAVPVVEACLAVCILDKWEGLT